MQRGRRERERLHIITHMESGAVQNHHHARRRRREETDDGTYCYRPRDASVAPREWSTYFPRVAYDRDDRRCGLASALIDAMCCDYNAGRFFEGDDERATSRLFDEVGAFFPVFQTDFDDFFAFREESSSSSGALREERTLRAYVLLLCVCSQPFGSRRRR